MMVYIKEVLDEVIFSTCRMRREIVGLHEGDPNMIEWKAAYSLVDGSYIGDAKDAQFFEEKGIVPQLRDKSHSTATIGFCNKEQRWYGWGRAGYTSFGIGDLDYEGKWTAKTLDDAKQMAIDFCEGIR